MLLDAWHRQTEWEADIAYELGQLGERDRIAGAITELDAAWRARGATVHRDRVAERLAEMERYAAGNPAATWRGFYLGGPVDWETGLHLRLLAVAA